MLILNIYIAQTNKDICTVFSLQAISEDIPVDGYVVVYSKIDRSTYDHAVDILHKLRHEQGSDRPIILVANKIDVVRKQQVSTDGKSVIVCSLFTYVGDFFSS